ncbi:hypothetical protein CFRS1_v002335 [Colletotrichum fructicola]|nr:hypothetical protein CFRS1_v002335 [Colletotrichum fructicola]
MCPDSKNIFTDATDRSRIAQSVFLQEFKGFNKEQEAKLKDKKRKRGGSKVAKWKDIFDILFPDAIETTSHQLFSNFKTVLLNDAT